MGISNWYNSTKKIFEKYRGRSVQREDGVIVEGLNVSICYGFLITAIILTYDKESDTYVKLLLFGTKGLKYKNCLKEKLEFEEELKL